MSIPDFPLGETVDFKFTTRQFSDGVPTTLAGSPVVEIYEDNSITQITTAETLTADFDGITGLNNLRVVATGGNGFESGKSYACVISTGTVGGTSVVGEVVAQFTIERSPALRPTTAGNTLDVAATGEAGVDLGNVTGTLTNANVAAFDANERVDVGEWLGTAAATPTVAGVPEVDVTHLVGGVVPTPTTTGVPDVNVERWLDTLVTLGSGAPDVNVASMDAGTVTAAVVATDAIDDDAIASGAIAASAFAAGALDAAALNADAVTEIRSLVSGTADSGSTTTMVDAIRTEADDVWIGSWILFTSGSIANQCRLITEFVAASDTVTFAPPTTAAVSTNTYEILPAGAVDVQSWVGLVTGLVAPNALVGGAVDADVSVMQANVLTASAHATDSINEIRDAILSDSTAFAGANVDAAVSTRATPAQVNTEVVDVLKTDTVTLPGQTAPPLTPTFEEMISWLYKVLRNRKDQTSTLWQLYADNETTVDAKATVSDDATTAIKQEIVTGP
jgi:hypothetical protein